MPWYEVVHKIKTIEQHVFAVQADDEEKAEQKVRDHSDYDTNDKPDIVYTDYSEDITDTDYDCEWECDEPEGSRKMLLDAAADLLAACKTFVAEMQEKCVTLGWASPEQYFESPPVSKDVDGYRLAYAAILKATGAKP